MEFGTAKSTKLIMEHESFEGSQVVEMPNGQTVRVVKKGQLYKYLVRLEVDEIKYEAMK